LAGVGGWEVVVAVAVAMAGVVVGIVEVVVVGSWRVVDREVVSGALHMVWYVVRVLVEHWKVGVGRAVPYGTEPVEAMEEQTHSGGYFGVEVRWRRMDHGEGWVAELTANWQTEEAAAKADLSCLFAAVEAGLDAVVPQVRAALEAAVEVGEQQDFGGGMAIWLCPEEVVGLVGVLTAVAVKQQGCSVIAGRQQEVLLQRRLVIWRGSRVC
jgi:hypothetical protein